MALEEQAGRRFRAGCASVHHCMLLKIAVRLQSMLLISKHEAVNNFWDSNRFVELDIASTHLHREQAARKRSGQFKPARQQAPPGEATRVPGCRCLECGTGSVFGKCSLSCSLCLRIDWVRCWSLLRGCRHSQPGLF